MQSNTWSSVNKSPARAVDHVLFEATSAAGGGVNVGYYLQCVFTGSVAGFVFTLITSSITRLQVLKITAKTKSADSCKTVLKKAVIINCNNFS